MTVATAAAAWGRTPAGEEVTRVELANDHVRLGLLTWGATVQSLSCPDATGEWADVVLGFDTLAPYLGEHPFIGCTLGRFANRIAGGRFELGGVTHQVPPNDGTSALHGGADNFGWRNWRLEEYDATSATLALTSPDGDMGFPGRLEVRLDLRLDGTRLRQSLTVTTDAPTVVNLTNHTYFNLHGTPARTIDDHQLTITGAAHLPVDDRSIPLPGPPTAVAGTGFDFRVARPVGPTPYDHTWLLDGDVVLRAAGRQLRITTTEPGVQLYTGHGLDGSLPDRAGRPLGPRSGLCLETQHFPDSPNRPDFPTTTLRPGEVLSSVTTWELTPA